MPRKLRNLVIESIALVDAGANQFARILLSKRAPPTTTLLTPDVRTAFAKLDDTSARLHAEVADYRKQFPEDFPMNDDVGSVCKSLTADVAKGRVVSVVKGDVVRVAHARAERNWLARGAPPGGLNTLINVRNDRACRDPCLRYCVQA